MSPCLRTILNSLSPVLSTRHLFVTLPRMGTPEDMPLTNSSVTFLSTDTMYSFSCSALDLIMLLARSPLLVIRRSPSESLSRRPTE